MTRVVGIGSREQVEALALLTRGGCGAEGTEPYGGAVFGYKHQELLLDSTHCGLEEVTEPGPDVRRPLGRGSSSSGIRGSDTILVVIVLARTSLDRGAGTVKSVA